MGFGFDVTQTGGKGQNLSFEIFINVFFYEHISNSYYFNSKTLPLYFLMFSLTGFSLMK